MIRKLSLFALCAVLLAAVILTSPFLSPQTAVAEETPLSPALPVQIEIDMDEPDGDLFSCDVDADGTEEKFSYHLNEYGELVALYMNGEKLDIDPGFIPGHVILIDLDPATPWINLLVTVDTGSDDYVTTEFHPENGKMVKGAEKDGIWLQEDGTLRVYERTDLLGTKDGFRTVSGEALTPDSEWLQCSVPEPDDPAFDRNMDLEFGLLLHTVKRIYATSGGEPVVIEPDTFLYMTRFHESERLAEICTEDGLTALITADCLPERYEYLINWTPQDELFDNILYAD